MSGEAKLVPMPVLQVPLAKYTIGSPALAEMSGTPRQVVPQECAWVAAQLPRSGSKAGRCS